MRSSYSNSEWSSSLVFRCFQCLPTPCSLQVSLIVLPLPLCSVRCTSSIKTSFTCSSRLPFTKVWSLLSNSSRHQEVPHCLLTRSRMADSQPSPCLVKDQCQRGNSLTPRLARSLRFNQILLTFSSTCMQWIQWWTIPSSRCSNSSSINNFSRWCKHRCRASTSYRPTAQLSRVASMQPPKTLSRLRKAQVVTSTMLRTHPNSSRHWKTLGWTNRRSRTF